MAEAVAEEYRSSLCDLNFNSKPHINMLTMLAEDNIQYAPVIVKTVLHHIDTVPPDVKLPSLYLVDSIMKNIGGLYIELFTKHMISLFTSVFSKVQEATRMALFKLRQTWDVVLPKHVLKDLDEAVKKIDVNWPTPLTVSSPAIHVNPKFLGQPKAQELPPAVPKPVAVHQLLKEPTPLENTRQSSQDIKQAVLQQIKEKKLWLKNMNQGAMPINQQTPLAPNSQVPINTKLQTQTNVLDPRLKRNASTINSVQVGAGFAKTNSSVLESVVAVATPEKSASDELVNKSAALSPKLTNKQSKPERNDSKHVNKSAENNTSATKRKSPNKKITHELPRQTGTDREPPGKRHSRKRSLSPEKRAMLELPKKVHKFSHPVNRLKRTLSQDSDSKQENGVVKKGKRDSKNVFKKTDAGVIKSSPRTDENFEDKLAKQSDVNSEDRLTDSVKSSKKDDKSFLMDERSRETPSLFGSEDRDYRQPLQTKNNFSRPQSPVFVHSAIKTDKHIHSESQSSVTNQKQESDTQYITHQIPSAEGLVNSRNNDVSSSKQTTDSLSREKDLGSRELTQPKPSYPSSKEPVVTSFNLDGKSRPIHIINQRAFIMADNNIPKEVKFIGPPRNVYIGGRALSSPLGFDGKILEFETNGKFNVIQFGIPTREVYVNMIPYRAQFGGPPIVVALQDRRQHEMLIDGPPPQLITSDQPAFDLFDAFNAAKNVRPLLKARPDGGMTCDIDMRQKKSVVSVRFDIAPGPIKDVDWRQGPLTNNTMKEAAPYPSGFPPHPSNDLFKGRASSNIPARIVDPNNPQWLPPQQFSELKPPLGIPVFDKILQKLEPPPMPPPNLAPLALLQNPAMPPIRPCMPLPNMVSGPLRPQWPPLQPPPIFTGQVPVLNDMQRPALPPPIANSPAMPPPPAPVPSSPVNVNTIYDKLVAAGIIPKKVELEKEVVIENVEPTEEEPVPIKEEAIPEMRFTPKCLKTYQSGIIALLYKGSQCATCGMRFKEIQSEQYSRHLDWHFRTNRREKDGAKKAFSRRLFYEIKDWVEFNEIEEAEERAPSYFELQSDSVVSKNAVSEKICSVPASECESEKCSVCGDQFQLFWVEEEEEWHLRHAVRHENEAYHPACYEDFKKASKSPELETKKEEESEDVKYEVSIKIEKTEETNSEKTPKEELPKSPAKLIETENTDMEIDVKPNVEELEQALLKEEDVFREPDKEEKVIKVDVEEQKTIETEVEEQKIIETDIEDQKEESEKEDDKASEKSDQTPTQDENSNTSFKTEEAVDDQQEEKDQKTEEKDSLPETDNTEKNEVNPVVQEEKSKEEEEDPKTEEKDSLPETGNNTEKDVSPVIQEEKGKEEQEELKTEEKDSVPETGNKKELCPVVQEEKEESASNSDDEFRPATPDPRFQVLPRVEKGTELSALCTIM